VTPATTTVWAARALLPEGWAARVTLTVQQGRITAVDTDREPPAAATRVGVLLPAPVNVHSHAFQHALAGLTERRGPDPSDTFWTWRTQMFRFLEQLSPDDIEAITAYVQMRMLEAGYAAVAEFHYLHHAPSGELYDHLGELSQRIVAAADQSGIGLTLLPVLYEVGGCDGRSLTGGQRRFGNAPDRFALLVDEARRAITSLPDDAGFGIAPHSLRAVTEDGLAAAVALAGEAPIHMHLAEQLGEVDEVLATRGVRPAEWLTEHCELSSQWTLIHCTHLTDGEADALARLGITAGLCPLTEANLGDGIFDAVRWADAGGAMAVGSDSNIRVALAEELRALDTSQRLRDHVRAVFATPERSSGHALYERILTGGARATGRTGGALEVGYWADLVALDTEATALIGREDDTLLDTWIFAGDDTLVCDVWSAGRHLVQGGMHRDRDRITRRYRQTMAALVDRL
jgi:formimidoylglutamate deiminase